MNGSPASGALTPADLAPGERAVLRRYRTWQRFHTGPRQAQQPLLAGLARHPDCVLVAGCQRSGTTMLTRLIARSRGFQSLALTADDELDAALVLAGEVSVPVDRRYCFQTTYLNERYAEYRLLQPGQRLIWVLRNPRSVVYSMLYNWRRYGLNELYDSCVAAQPAGAQQISRRALFGPSRAERACIAYAGKTAQIMVIRELIPATQLLVIDYDRMVAAPQEWLPRIFAFIGAAYDPRYTDGIRADSVHKAQAMSRSLAARVESLAAPAYRQCAQLIADGSPGAS